jgi:hypothetical protein
MGLVLVLQRYVLFRSSLPLPLSHSLYWSFVSDAHHIEQTSQPEIITDIMFLHERGAYNTLYFTAYFGSLMVRTLSPSHLRRTSN